MFTPAANAQIFDRDLDKKTDITVYRPRNGWWIIAPSSGALPYAVTWGASSIIDNYDA